MKLIGTTCHLCGSRSNTFHLFRCQFTGNTEWHNIYSSGHTYAILKSFDYHNVGLIMTKGFNIVSLAQLEYYGSDGVSKRWTEYNPVDICSSKIWCGLKYTELAEPRG